MIESKDKTNKEKTTKERIFEAAIDLFAHKGFDATSLRDIAAVVGIKQPSLYGHYKSKDEILEKILEYPMERMGSIGPQNIETEELIVSMGLEKFMIMAGDLALSWMEDPYMEKIWRIICIELYHNNQIKKFYSEFQITSCSYWVSSFSIMMEHKLIKPSNPRILALEYLSFYGNAYMEYFLLQYDNTSGSFLQEYKDRVNQHTAFIVDSIKRKGF